MAYKPILFSTPMVKAILDGRKTMARLVGRKRGEKQMTLGSLFDGSGGFPLAGKLCGITPVWASEIEPFPIAVTRERLPEMTHVGDVTKLDGTWLPFVDVITFGSPCQDMSIAGKRAGLKNQSNGDDVTTRSGLFYEAARIIKEMRDATNGLYPTYAVWENVPGAFTSNKGQDFKAVLETLAQIKTGRGFSIPMPHGGWKKAGCVLGDDYSIAWRTLDAQYFGVPQRRRRIYLVADFAGQCAPEILFERESMPRDIRQSTAQGQEAADDAARSPIGSRGAGKIECLATGHAAAFSCGQGAKARGIGCEQDVTPTLISTPSGTNAVPDVVYALQGNGIDHADTAGCNGCGWRKDEGYTLNTIDRHAVVYDTTQITSPTNRSNPQDGDACHALAAHQHPPLAVCVGNGQTNQIWMDERTGTLNCMHDQQAVIMESKPPRKYIVRRLTPLECCRLQGFPDDWADIPTKTKMTNEELVFWSWVRAEYAAAMDKSFKPMQEDALLKWYNKLNSDSAVYKMWGNGIALPCAQFVLDGIAKTLRKESVNET